MISTSTIETLVSQHTKLYKQVQMIRPKGQGFKERLNIFREHYRQATILLDELSQRSIYQQEEQVKHLIKIALELNQRIVKVLAMYI